MGRSPTADALFPLLLLAQQIVAQAATGADSPAPSQAPANQGYNGGEDNPQDPSDAGAAGASKGAFNLSKGGLAAIIVVAVLVGVLGIGSAVLFWLAKKRQWDVRQSIRRASRRLTGRSTVDVSSKRQNRRTGVRLDSPPRPNRKHEQERDVEKGVPHNGAQTTKTTITSTFDLDTPTPKASRLGGKR